MKTPKAKRLFPADEAAASSPALPPSALAGQHPAAAAPPHLKDLVSVAEWVVQQRQAAGQRASQYVGVGWDSCKRRWVSDIFHDGCGHSLGEYLEEEAAARAFDEAARRLRGDKAHGGRDGIWRLNFPTEAETTAQKGGGRGQGEE